MVSTSLDYFPIIKGIGFLEVNPILIVRLFRSPENATSNQQSKITIAKAAAA